ncbi:MAG: universal stress protein [Desulfobulbus sp.]|nr:universal stress protein [Desulfobulbus sp.]
MRIFKNILYASTGLHDDIEGLKHALALAHTNSIPLTFFLTFPQLGGAQQSYQEKFAAFLALEAQTALQKARAALMLEDDMPPVTFIVEDDQKSPVNSIVRQVQRNKHDLLIKEAEPQEEPGFKTLDMTLLRHCPCSIWLAQPISRAHQDVRVAAAVNPESQDQVYRDLSLWILEVGRTLANHCSGRLDICSCWDFEFERYLRGSSLADMPDRNILSAVDYAEATHFAELNNLIHEAGIDEPFHIHRLKGRPEDRIPAFVRGRGIDILVMGSMSRTGITGFFVGNTAEDIINQLNCTLVALKLTGSTGSTAAL